MISPYKGREVNPHKPVYVYRNLADKHNGLGRWSLLQGGHVVAHADALVMHGFDDKPVEFIVRPGGFARAQTEQSKNVHAFFKGSLALPGESTYASIRQEGLRPVQYDFRRGDRFFDVESGNDVTSAEMALLNENGAFYA